MFNLGWKNSPKIISMPNLEKLRKYSQVWQSASFPDMQNKFTKNILTDYKNIPAIVSLLELTKQVAKKGDSVLEIGCSTGYHGKIFQLEKLGLAYEGCDYSRAFIERAKALYPKLTFKVADNTSLSYRKGKFNLVISGCCILHIIDYEKAISETARVAKNYVIFHRTPIINFQKTTFVTKKAYGVEMLEIIFNESELVNLFAKAHLAIISIETTGSYEVPGIKEPVLLKEYLCLKI